jgi:hypothetical protein
MFAQGHWVLIILMVKECKAFYLDSLKNKLKRNYKVLSQILNSALSNMLTEVKMCQKKGKGCVRFKHYTYISCTHALSIIHILVAHSNMRACHVATISATIWTSIEITEEFKQRCRDSVVWYSSGVQSI